MSSFLRLSGLIRSQTFVATLFLFVAFSAAADSLDEGVADDPLLRAWVDGLADHDIDVTSNLNSREVIRQRIRRARLGRFPDLPIATFPASDEIEYWEAAFAEGDIGAVVILLDTEGDISDTGELAQRWLSGSDSQRLFVSFFSEDSAAAERLAQMAADGGHGVELYFGSQDSSVVGRYYATAAQRLAIDSRAARRYRTDVTEFSYLGERVRRRSNSLFADDGNKGDGSLARREPSVFMKESLGDEFNQSTISEIIVPGGVALGETADLDIDVSELVFEGGALSLIDEGGMRIGLPDIAAADAKALFDFVARSEAIQSDAIVDIDADGRVRISAMLRDTEVGYEIMHADTQPFEYISNLPVTKSVVIDTEVEWSEAEGGALEYTTDFEVRFLSADNMRIAQTRVALEYEYDSSKKTIEYSDSWGRDVGRLHENVDYSGLGNSMELVAGYAGWVGLFRHLLEKDVKFLCGRYEFMMVDKAGRKTPIRY